MRVLIVDDEPLELDQLEWMIHKFNSLWEVRRAADGNEALAFFEEENADLLLLDINMPGLSGLELATILREKMPDLLIIMVTAQTDFSSTQQALRLGVADYVSKPIIEKELMAVLNQHGKEKEKPKSSLISNAQQIVKTRFAERLTLVDLANTVHVHPAYLSRRFHEEMGMPLTEFTNRCRLDKACELLLQHYDWSIAEVAERVGFTSQHYFSTQFRRHTGMTPRQYRDQQGKK